MAYANTTYDRPILARLAAGYSNKLIGTLLAQEVVGWTPNVDVEAGSFRAAEDGTYFNRANTVVPKSGYPNSFSFSDSTVNFDLQRFGGSFEFAETELNQPSTRGYKNKQDMIRRNTERISEIMRIDLEARFATFFTTSGNYASGFTYACTALPSGEGVQWNTLNTSDPLKDVTVIKEILWAVPNVMIIGVQLFHKLQQHSKLTSATTVMGSKRDKGVNPTITPEFLQNYFDIEKVYVSRAIYNSTPNEASMTKSYLWDSDNVFIGYIDKDINVDPQRQSFARNYVLDLPGENGWGARETTDARARKHLWDIDFYQAYAYANQKYGFLLTNVMA